MNYLYAVERKSGNTYAAMEMCEPSVWKFETYEEAKNFFDSYSSPEQMQKEFLDTVTSVSPIRHKNRVVSLFLYSNFYGIHEHEDEYIEWGYEDALKYEQEHDDC